MFTRNALVGLAHGASALWAQPVDQVDLRGPALFKRPSTKPAAAVKANNRRSS
jgi:hypothetical protein